MPTDRMNNRKRMRRALDSANLLAHDLEVMGYRPQAQLVREIEAALYTTQINRAVADLAKG